MSEEQKKISQTSKTLVKQIWHAIHVPGNAAALG